MTVLNVLPVLAALVVFAVVARDGAKVRRTADVRRPARSSGAPAPVSPVIVGLGLTPLVAPLGDAGPGHEDRPDPMPGGPGPAPYEARLGDVEPGRGGWPDGGAGDGSGDGGD